MEGKVKLTEDPSEMTKTCIKKRNRITLQQKKEICEYKRNHPEAFAREIFLHFRSKWPNIVAPSTISKILMSEDKWLNQHDQDSNRKTCTRIYQPRNIPLEDALYKWYTSVKDNISVSNEILKQKAKSLAKLLNIQNFCCSNNWVYSFKKRHKLLKYTHKIATTGTSFLNIDLDYPSDMQEQPSPPASNKTSYFEDEFGNGTIYVTAPITSQEARQGLVSAMGYLAAHAGIRRDNIDVLWTIFQQINNDDQTDRVQQSSEESVQNNVACSEKDTEETRQMDICDEDMKATLTDKKVTADGEVLDVLYDQCIGKFTVGPAQHVDTDDAEDFSSLPPNGRIQLAVQGADGKYLYVMAESDSQDEELNLNESLPQILQAAGHSLEDGTQFIETIDQCSGLRMITKHLPQVAHDALVQVLSPEKMDDGILSDVTTPGEKASDDHAYVMIVSTGAGGGPSDTENAESLSGTEMADVALQDDATDVEVSGKVHPDESNVNASETGKVNAGTFQEGISIGRDNENVGSDNGDRRENDDEAIKNSAADGGVEKATQGKTDSFSFLKALEKKAIHLQSNESPDSMGDSHLSVVSTGGLDNTQTEFPVKQTADSIPRTLTSSACLKPCFVKVSRLPQSVLKTTSLFYPAATPSDQRQSCTKGLNKSVSDLEKFTYACCFCEKVFSRRSSYKWHMSSHNKNECLCIACTNATKEKNKAYDSHQKKSSALMCKDEVSCPKVNLANNTDAGSDSDVEETKPYVCQTCGSCFSTTSDLHNHRETHHGVKEWKCSTCNRCFSRSADVKRHSRVHLLPPDMSCEMCGKTFVNRSNLLKHSRLHTGIQDYNCSVCGKCFPHSAGLKEHKKTHKNTRNRKCEVCGQTFVLVRNLNMHMLMHDEVGTSQRQYKVRKGRKKAT